MFGYLGGLGIALGTLEVQVRSCCKLLPSGTRHVSLLNECRKATTSWVSEKQPLQDGSASFTRKLHMSYGYTTPWQTHFKGPQVNPWLENSPNILHILNNSDSSTQSLACRGKAGELRSLLR